MSFTLDLRISAGLAIISSARRSPLSFPSALFIRNLMFFRYLSLNAIRLEFSEADIFPSLSMPSFRAVLSATYTPGAKNESTSRVSWSLSDTSYELPAQVSSFFLYNDGSSRLVVAVCRSRMKLLKKRLPTKEPSANLDFRLTRFTSSLACEEISMSPTL